LDRIGAVLVDTYRIERLIAEGGMGAVYEASHLRIPKRFAVKFLKVSLLENEVALLRFRREAEVIATLEHPHIVSLLDYNMTEDGVPYTVLEFLEGEHLGDRVNRGRLPMSDVLRIAEAVAGALSTAHAKGIVHRDLKPENVMLGPTGGVKVVDFGIAKLRGGQELTAFNSIVGTVTYMAPEQLMAGTIDARADQFAFGAIVYEMLSGEMPFGCDGTIPEIAQRVMRQQPKPLVGYPQALTDVVLHAMAKEPGDRYATVADFFDAFKKIAEGDTAGPRTERSLPIVVVTPAEGLPELAGEATSISMTPIASREEPIPAAVTVLAPNPLPEAPMPSAVTVLAPNPLPELSPETTRVLGSTPSTPEPPQPVGNDTLRPGAHARSSQVTGRTSAIASSRLPQIGQRAGIVIGVVIGVVIAAVVGLVLR
jgi:serine/threonine protein kinase